MHQPGFPWLCCPKLFDALVCHGQACLEQVLLALLCFDLVHLHHILIVSCTVTCVLTTNFPPPALCANLHIVLHCPALYCPLLHCIVPACIAPPCQSVSRQKPFVSLAASTLFVEEAAFCFNCPRKASSDLIDPNPCCVTERSYFGSKLPANLGLLLVLLGTVWKMSLQRDPDSGLIVTNHGEVAYFEFNCGRRAKPVTGSCSIITWEASTLN